MQSCSNPSRTYNIDISLYTCNCLAFKNLKLLFCKHIFAVQIYFPEKCNLAVLGTLTSNLKQIQAPTSQQLAQPKSTDPNSKSEVQSSGGTQLVEKLQRLVGTLISAPPSNLSTTLLNLQQAVDAALIEHDPRQILPRPLPVPPNQHSWTETAEVMGVAVKTKKRKNTDPYSGGERSGKRAQPDALRPPPVTHTFPSTQLEHKKAPTVLQPSAITSPSPSANARHTPTAVPSIGPPPSVIPPSSVGSTPMTVWPPSIQSSVGVRQSPLFSSSFLPYYSAPDTLSVHQSSGYNLPFSRGHPSILPQQTQGTLSSTLHLGSPSYHSASGEFIPYNPYNIDS